MQSEYKPNAISQRRCKGWLHCGYQIKLCCIPAMEWELLSHSVLPPLTLDIWQQGAFTLSFYLPQIKCTHVLIKYTPVYLSPETSPPSLSELYLFEMKCPRRHLFILQILCGNECILKNLNIRQAQCKTQKRSPWLKELSITQMWNGWYRPYVLAFVTYPYQTEQPEDSFNIISLLFFLTCSALLLVMKSRKSKVYFNFHLIFFTQSRNKIVAGINSWSNGALLWKWKILYVQIVL